MPESAETQAPRELPRTWVSAISYAVPPSYLVSREKGLDQLHQRLRAAQGGYRQVLFITGEAGIGKTALADVFVHDVMMDGMIERAREVLVSLQQARPSP